MGLHRMLLCFSRHPSRYTCACGSWRTEVSYCIFFLCRMRARAHGVGRGIESVVFLRQTLVVGGGHAWV